jgi:putative ABC transport system permease protein
MFKDNFDLAYKNIRERMSRSILTLLGIAIGIMAIISLMAVGEGMNEAVTGELSTLSDTIIVSTGSGFSTSGVGMGGSASISEDNGKYLTDRDIADIKRIHGVEEVNTQLSSTGAVEFNGKDEHVSIVGMDSKSMELRYGRENLESGSLLDEGDKNKIVIGYEVAHEYFDSDVSIGNRIKVNGKKFVVHGIFAEEGGGSISSTSNSVLLILEDFKKLTGESNIRVASVVVYDIDNVELIADEIEQKINENHGEDDYVTTNTMSSILDSIQNVIGIMQTVLLAIASIALVVASIGIMNTMLTSVMERTHDIGIMKAIGAMNKDIMLIFIFEGMLVSVVGGVFGILFGIFGSQAISSLMFSSGMGGGVAVIPIITIVSIGIAVGVSIFVGVLSSLYPALKAARMSPIEAVRYE